MRLLTRQPSVLFLGCLLALTLLAVGCGGAAPATSATIAAPTSDGALAAATVPAGGAALPTSTAPAAPDQGAYPAAESVNPYPSEGEAALPADSYPAPPTEEALLEPRFRIDQPVTAATTTITGQAPPNLALAIMDVSYGGVPLGSGRSDENGAFSIPVSGLIQGNRIGLAIAELPEGMDLVQTAETYFPHRGEGFQNLPNLGVFYDTTLVQ